jgi:hypothetical protein
MHNFLDSSNTIIVSSNTIVSVLKPQWLCYLDSRQGVLDYAIAIEATEDSYVLWSHLNV